MKFIQKTNVMVVLLISTVLISCGGGGDDGSSATKSVVTTVAEPAPEPTPEPTPAPEPATTCPPSVHPYENFLAIGDSMTGGTGDNVASDNVTTDGCYKGMGYPPVLIDKLDEAKGRKHVVINKGVGGAVSADGVQSVAFLLGGDSMHVLVMYGTNDSGTSGGNAVDPKQFKVNMQNIINKIQAAGKNAYLAKVPSVLGDTNNHQKYEALGVDLDRGTRNQTIQQYNKVIDELVSENGIRVTPPDFYNYFKSRPELYSDNLHFNGIGYQHMAELWSQSLRSL